MKKTKSFVLFSMGIFVVLVSLASLTLAHVGDDDYRHHSGMMSGVYGGMMGYSGYGIGVFAWITWLLVVVAIILLIAWLIKQLNKKR